MKSFLIEIKGFVANAKGFVQSAPNGIKGEQLIKENFAALLLSGQPGASRTYHVLECLTAVNQEMKSAIGPIPHTVRKAYSEIYLTGKESRWQPQSFFYDAAGTIVQDNTDSYIVLHPLFMEIGVPGEKVLIGGIERRVSKFRGPNNVGDRVGVYSLDEVLELLGKDALWYYARPYGVLQRVLGIKKPKPRAECGVKVELLYIGKHPICGASESNYYVSLEDFEKLPLCK